MDLGELNQKFEPLTDDDFVFSVAFNNPHSYRGYYNQVAFEPTYNVSLKEIKESIVVALMNAFIGYKGGEYKYNKSTTANLAVYSCWETDAEQRLELLVEQMINEYLEADHPTAKLKKKRKTAAEKEAEADARRRALDVEFWVEFSKTYYQRLMDHVFYFMKHSSDLGYFVNSTENSFEFSNQTWWKEILVLPKTLPTEYGREIIDDMAQLDAVKETRESNIAESQRLATVRKEAIAKLTAEERKVLGLEGK